MCWVGFFFGGDGVGVRGGVLDERMLPVNHGHFCMGLLPLLHYPLVC